MNKFEAAAVIAMWGAAAAIGWHAVPIIQMLALFFALMGTLAVALKGESGG